MDPVHAALLGSVIVASWLLLLYAWPALLLVGVYRRAILSKGFGEGPVPINALYAEPANLFADPLAAQSARASNLMTVGVNHDTLATVAWLDLRAAPLVLRVPAMPGRYYAVQLTDPWTNTSFAYVGTRATGSEAGEFLITGPRWSGDVPAGMRQIRSPRNAALLLGRVLVLDDDARAAHDLAAQIQLAPLGNPPGPGKTKAG